MTCQRAFRQELRVSGGASFRSGRVEAAIPTSPRTRAIRISFREGRIGIRNVSMKMKRNATLAAIAHPLPEGRALQIVQETRGLERVKKFRFSISPEAAFNNISLRRRVGHFCVVGMHFPSPENSPNQFAHTFPSPNFVPRFPDTILFHIVLTSPPAICRISLLQCAPASPSRAWNH